jgi:hypothetical protein
MAEAEQCVLHVITALHAVWIRRQQQLTRRVCCLQLMMCGMQLKCVTKVFIDAVQLAAHVAAM